MKVRLKIERFNPEQDERPSFSEYTVEARNTDRVLDLLMRVKREQDGTLAFRKSCAHGVCGSDAMRINGVERLACKTLVQDVASGDGAEVLVQPLRNLPVQKDLMVDQDEFFRKYRTVKPFLVNDDTPPEREWIQSREQRSLIDDATKCILCEACYSACPVVQETNPRFIGPAQIVQGQRFNDDTRDRGFALRLEALDVPDGVWACENHFQCTEVCPRGIKVTKLINQTKRSIKKHRDERGEKIHDQ
jgi:succinate dehydrogenase / fumarate reductase iron-sulfur subunit